MSYFQRMTSREVSERDFIAHRTEEALVPATAM